MRGSGKEPPHLPSAIKDDLQVLADKAEIKLSTFVREILISHLLALLMAETATSLVARRRGCWFRMDGKLVL